MKNILERYPFFLVLLPAFVVIHLEKELHQVINYRFVIDRILIFFAVPLLLFTIIYFLNRSVKKSAFAAFILSIPFFYLGDLKNWMSFVLPGSFWQSYSFLLTTIFIISIISIYLVQRSGSEFRKQFLLTNTGLLLFITIDLALIAYSFNKGKYHLVNEIEIENKPCDNCEKPDIYYIVLDTYTSGKILKSNFNYPNNVTEDDLRKKGFYIAANSKSNYSYTAFSIGSTLNMNYFKKVDTINKIYDREYLQSLKLLYKNRLLKFLEKENYGIFNHSVVDFGTYPSTVNHFDNWGFRELFDQYNILLKMKMDLGFHLPDWVNDLSGKNKYFINAPLNRYKFDSLVLQYLEESINLKTENPKFVYAHFLKPHPPYAFDSLGNALDMSTTSNEDAYIHQIATCNRIIKEVTDTILASSKKPLVIILQGDHGVPFTNESEPDKKLNSFNAIYFSNRNYSLLNDSVTNVNTFRIVLNTFFQKNLPLLPDEFYIFKN